ncbi:chromodomain-helicase-DNA-binding protein 1-like isoform X1 [Salmo salar]|uniref:Chromodomain-helicase-DNA-binding protein 1-like isoform X1 n=1 Tax=Salmo salar TaxID=8030 RepID=A0ABM3C9F8_SALSA|nr:chromodomain-helicase-DNA-binding protein 1-like isoform X1 [Salmo salar]
MASFPQKIKTSIPEETKNSLTEKDLQKWGLQGIQLRAYQLDGVQWLTQCLANQQGCILGDEMGLGKTCQTISLLLYMRGALRQDGPFLVLSPLSVMDNWRSEMKCLSPCLKVLCYSGDKDKRAELQRDMNNTHYHVLLTTYELCIKDASFLKRRKWKILVVDEAHRLKNQNSLLHKILMEFSLDFRVLLTGTPIQNNLTELYSLLSFVQPSLFPIDQTEDFTNTYNQVQTQPTLASDLQRVLQPFLLRRVKAEVAADLPVKTEILMYHGLSALQKRYYKAILMKDLYAFGNEQGNKTRLLNILMQLRKCVDHPYLFNGVEPEPFEMGEHLIQASGKLCLLDSMLAYLHQGGHHILLFSQMTRMLDILQDYMEYRGYSYERLDGSVRGEERNLAIKNFSSKDVFVFLLSTKAGGVGMNLTAADTVIFIDSDFNPQNDLQAAARCHRIGQTRAVKVIRLLGRDTVEEIVYSRAVSKLRLTNTVIEEGRFSLLNHTHSAAAAGLQLSEILKFGVDKLLSSEESSIQAVNLGLILGQSRDGEWLTDEAPTQTKDLPTEEEEEEESEGQNHMYYFEGRDYSREMSSEDQRTFSRLQEEEAGGGGGGERRATRHNDEVCLSGPLLAPMRKRKALTETDLKEREEAAAKRARLQEDKRRRLQENKHRKKMAWWESNGYRSLCLPSVESEEEEEEEEEADDLSVTSTDSEHSAISYVLGDVTHPYGNQDDAIIVHCVDDSGRWGRGGLFTALENRSDEPRRQYELAGKMKDLKLGSVLLFPVDDKQSRLDGQDQVALMCLSVCPQVALIVAQHRARDNSLSGIHLSALEEGLQKIYRVAKTNKAGVHLPRIGHSTRGFNWYGTERLIRKHLASRGVHTSIYYYSRSVSTSALGMSTTPSIASASAPTSKASAPTSKASASTSKASASTSKASVSLSPSPPHSPPVPQYPGPDSDRESEEGETANQSSDRGSEEGETANQSSRTPSPADPALPDFMRGVHVFFYNLTASDRKRLARYLITYEGDEEEIMSSEVTHIVTELESPVQSQELQELIVQHPHALPVQKTWLEACFSRQRQVNTTKFLHCFK